MSGSQLTGESSMNLYNESLPQDDDETPTQITREEYDEAKKHYREMVRRGDMLRRLNENEDFYALIIDGYFRDEPNRIANLMASGKLNDASMTNCKNELAAIGAFRNFLKLMIDQANVSQDELVGLELAYDEAVEAGVIE